MVINKGIETKLFEIIRNTFRETLFYQLLGIELAELGAGKALLRVDTTRQHTNPIGYIHGGLLMSIADAAMGNAIRSLGYKSVTVDMSTSFLASTQIGKEIQAQGEVVKAGKNLFFAEARVTSDARLLVTCKGTFFNIGKFGE